MKRLFIIFFIFIHIFCKTYSQNNTINFNKNAYQELQDSIDFSNNNDVIVDCAYKYYDLSKKEKNKVIQIKGIYNLGVAKWLIADYNNSISSFYKSLELAQNIKDTLIQINSSIYLGLIYSRTNDWDMVKKYYEFAYKLSHNFNDFYLIASSCWNMAFLSNSIGKNKEAIQFANESLVFLNKNKFKTEYSKHFAYGLVYYYLADIYKNQGNLDLSIRNLEKTIEENTLINNINILTPTFNQLSEVYLIKKQYDSSIYYAKKSLKLSFEIKNITYSLYSYWNLSCAFQGKKKLDSAFNYLSLYSKFLDSVNKNDTRVISAKLEAANQQKLMQKENEIKIVQKNNLLVLSLIILGALFIISLLLYSKYRLKNKTNKKLAELNHTKDKFFTIISHDLQTPISSFNSLTEILTDYYNELTEVEKLKYLKSLKESSNGILKLLDNLLTWSRVQTHKMKTYPEIHQLVSIVDLEIQNQKQFADKKNIVINSTITDNIYVFVDKDMIGMVFRNLLSNAIKYTSTNGKISILSHEEKDFFEINILDNGVGIKDEDKTKLFMLEVKHSTVGTDNEKGTGLGLNLCKEFIEKNCGKIWFESNLGVGSIFKFTLPKAIIDNN